VRRLLGQRVYLDSNILIYFVDRSPGYFELASTLITMADAGSLRAVTSDLSIAEVMVQPYRSGDQRVIDGTRAFLERRGLFEIRRHSYRDFLAAAQIRGTGNVGLVDALHVSTAVNAGVRYLVTNDARMPSVPGLEVLRLEDLEQIGG